MKNTPPLESAVAFSRRGARGGPGWYWPWFTVIVAAGGFVAGRLTAPESQPQKVAAGRPSMVSPSAAEGKNPPAKKPERIKIKEEKAAPAEWKEEWEKAARQPGSAQRESELARLLERLAASDAATAIGVALAEPNLRVRSALIGAVLRGWGGVAPREALAWSVQHVGEEIRRETHQSLVAGLAASGQPPDQLLILLCRTDPELASDYGIAFVTELARTRRFQEAVQAALTAPPDRLDHWVGAAFRQWAEYEPREALQAVDAVADPSARSTALQNLASGWAAASPAAMAQYAEQLPPGEWRQTVLREALQSWVKADTAAAIKWIEKYAPEPALDTGTAAIATLPGLIAVKPDIAASWAESIVDAELRESTFGDVIRLWAQTDAAAARKYALSSAALDATARDRLLDGLVP